MPAESIKYLRIDLDISSVPYSVVLTGLEAWLDRELISDVDLRWRNARTASNRLMVVAIENERNN